MDEGIEIYDKLKNILNSDIFPDDDELLNKIKTNHLYFLEQRHEASELEDTKEFYSVRVFFFNLNNKVTFQICIDFLFTKQYFVEAYHILFLFIVLHTNLGVRFLVCIVL